MENVTVCGGSQSFPMKCSEWISIISEKCRVRWEGGLALGKMGKGLWEPLCASALGPLLRPLPSPVGTCPALPHLVCLSFHPPPGLSQHIWAADTALCLSDRCAGMDWPLCLEAQQGPLLGTLRPGEGEAAEQMFLKTEKGLHAESLSLCLWTQGQWCARSQRSFQTQTTGLCHWPE